LGYELDAYARRTGTCVTFNREARTLFLKFATSPQARWTGNFRDLNAAIIRMATLAPGGRITRETVEEEIERLRAAWHTGDANEEAGDCDADALTRVLGKERAEALDLFDRQQLAGVLHICHESQTLSEAGRKLFTASRGRRKTTNDADRLRKFLARFELDWKTVRASAD